MRGAALLATAAAFAAILAPSAAARSPLTISKTAEASWTRTFEWTIDKSVTPASHDMQTGQSGDSTYTIALTKSAGTDSKVTVAGSVCVTNNGTFATQGLVIRDRIRATASNGATLTLINTTLDVSGNPVLDAGESHCYPYSFQITPVAGATNYRNIAQATITNDPRNPGSPLGPSVTRAFTIPAPTLVNNSVNVDDTYAAGDKGPFTGSASYSYKRTFTCDGDEGTHVNTATIVETKQSDTATVTVRCTPPPPPDKGCTYTQGYWKTHSKYGPAPYDATWALIGEDSTFFLSGKSWYQAFWTPPAGNPYYILAHQYMAARLNVVAGASTTPAVDSALSWATTFFSTYAPSTAWTDQQKADIVAAAGTLADYNEGDIGPGHCD